jgi:hypothetical protein
MLDLVQKTALLIYITRRSLEGVRSAVVESPSQGSISWKQDAFSRPTHYSAPYEISINTFHELPTQALTTLWVYTRVLRAAMPVQRARKPTIHQVTFWLKLRHYLCPNSMPSRLQIGMMLDHMADSLFFPCPLPLSPSNPACHPSLDCQTGAAWSFVISTMTLIYGA